MGITISCSQFGSGNFNLRVVESIRGAISAVAMVLRALPAMMQWVRMQKPGESGINIVTADFVELGDFISTVIKLNYVFDEGEANT
ncbi:PI-PLC X domain-containing protein 3 [Sciurus carolinensis]|uniref:PI-PLC X domain-containing protein 3 n=1 Tax=Sciurus carolinensis TaxID=30640 RepID=A0AA41T920_SCICA|nr:PI-PLC X domain-containing protein 3 [Sciurus carolinensis]